MTLDCPTAVNNSGPGGGTGAVDSRYQPPDPAPGLGQQTGIGGIDNVGFNHSGVHPHPVFTRCASTALAISASFGCATTSGPHRVVIS